MTSCNFQTYLSPFSWRYGSQEMRQTWSEYNKRLLWRTIWLQLAEVQSEFGLVSSEQVADLQAHVQEVDVERSLKIEADIHHDLMAELQAYAEQCPVGGKILHAGATSMDIEDNADAIRILQSLRLISARLKEILKELEPRIIEWADLPVIAFTHLQPAEPTTLGYRMAYYAQDFLEAASTIKTMLPTIRGKGFKGAVGTGASYAELIGVDNLSAFEDRLAARLGLKFYPITNQTYPRSQEYAMISGLAGVALAANKFAFDLRIMQSPAIGELSEPFGRDQVGSSAMPFKRNPVQSEKINSLARSLAQMPVIAWQNAAQSLLERTLDDSANRRTLLPEAFLTCDELLLTTRKVIQGLQINHQAAQKNLELYAPFAGTERLLMALTKAGADRQEMHQLLRTQSMLAWDEIKKGQPNPLIEWVVKMDDFRKYLREDEIRASFDIKTYLGDAPARTRRLAETIANFIVEQGDNDE